jgi:hypothetical protein
MNLTDDEHKLIEFVRKARNHANQAEETVILVRYIPLGEGTQVQQVLKGQPLSIFGVRLQMKKLLDDLIATNQSSSFFSITYEPGLLRVFEH